MLKIRISVVESVTFQVNKNSSIYQNNAEGEREKREIEREKREREREKREKERERESKERKIERKRERERGGRVV